MDYELSFIYSVIVINLRICRPRKTKIEEKQALATSSDSGQSESEERSTDSDEPEGCIKQRKFGPELWHDVVVQKDQELPSANRQDVSIRSC